MPIPCPPWTSPHTHVCERQPAAWRAALLPRPLSLNVEVLAHLVSAKLTIKGCEANVAGDKQRLESRGLLCRFDQCRGSCGGCLWVAPLEGSRLSDLIPH